MAKAKFTDEDDALLAELGVEVEERKASSRSAREERIIAGFEDIERFFEQHGRVPTNGEDIYGALGTTPWTWTRTSGAPILFKQWLANNLATLQNDGISRRFGGHRPYESLEISQHNRGTAAAIESYVSWIGANRGHQLLFDDALAIAGNDPTALFDRLYRKMKVSSFGRLAKFDYLTMLGKLGFVPIEPGSPYLQGATGPLRGARLLFTGNTDSESIPTKILDQYIVELGAYIGVGMQVMEDSLCNWQKSPDKFEAYRG